MNGWEQAVEAQRAVDRAQRRALGAFALLVAAVIVVGALLGAFAGVAFVVWVLT